MEHPMDSRVLGGKGPADKRGDLERRQGSTVVWLRAAPGTKRHRVTEPHGRPNRDMNSASVCPALHNRDKKERAAEGKNKQTRGSAHYYICPLSC